MKKVLYSIAALSMFAGTVKAQTWSGTTVPTLTNSKVAIGTLTTENTKLTIKNIQSETSQPYQGTSALKIMNGASITDNNVFEIWNGSYTTYVPGPGQPGTVVWNPQLVFSVNNRDQVAIKNSLRIGATAANGAYANYKLSVDGDMIAKRCVIQVDNWADYVFADNYYLPTLNEVEAYVKENNHLPGVPSEAEVKEKGMDVGDMNKILMQKVEELTLYIINLKKQVEVLEAKTK